MNIIQGLQWGAAGCLSFTGAMLYIVGLVKLGWYLEERFKSGVIGPAAMLAGLSFGVFFFAGLLTHV